MDCFLKIYQELFLYSLLFFINIVFMFIFLFKVISSLRQSVALSVSKIFVYLYIVALLFFDKFSNCSLIRENFSPNIRICKKSFIIIFKELYFINILMFEINVECLLLNSKQKSFFSFYSHQSFKTRLHRYLQLRPNP